MVKGVNHRLNPFNAHSYLDFFTKENLDLLTLRDPVVKSMMRGGTHIDIMHRFGINLHIQLLNSEVSYQAGEKLMGHIFLDAKQTLRKFNKLVLYLKGYEETEFD